MNRYSLPIILFSTTPPRQLIYVLLQSACIDCMCGPVQEANECINTYNFCAGVGKTYNVISIYALADESRSDRVHAGVM